MNTMNTSNSVAVTFHGILNGIDNYDKIRIIIDPSDVSAIEDLIYSIINDTRYKTNIHTVTYDNEQRHEYYISLLARHKEYYLTLAETHQHQQVSVCVSLKRYNFDGKKGITFILKYMDIININDNS